MSLQLGEITLRMMSAASSNSRPRISQLANCRQTCLRAPCMADGRTAIASNPTTPSSAPYVTTRMATVSTRSAAPRANWATVSSISRPGNRGPRDAAEADVTRGGVHGFGEARRRPISPAIVRRAQMRAALEHLARDGDLRRARIATVFGAAAARVARNAARLHDVGGMAGL